MLFQLSNRPDGFSLVLKESLWLEPERIAPQLATALKLPRADAVRMCRRQRGILFSGAGREQAEETAACLANEGIQAVVVADAELPLLPGAITVSVASLADEGLRAPSVQGIGMPDVWRYEHLALVTAGVLMDPKQQAATLLERAGEGALSEEADRRSLAAGVLERARGRVFPLRAELERDEPQVAEALTAALRGEGQSDTEIPGFGVISTAVDLVFTRPFERLRLVDNTRVQGIARSRNRARMLHDLLGAIVPRADGATVAGTALAIQQAVDSGDYVFEDMQQFDAYSRWAYWRRLSSAGNEKADDPDREGEQS
jgi:hypothetical protein